MDYIHYVICWGGTTGTEDYSVDIVNSEGKCFKDIYCNGSDYEMTVPGKTVFTIVKAGKAKPRVFLGDGA